MNRLYIPSIALLLCVFSLSVSAQGVKIGSTAAIDNSAILELQSTTQGLLVPRLSAAQMSTLATSAQNGLIVYRTDGAVGLYEYDGSAWRQWKHTLAGRVSMLSNSILEGEGFSRAVIEVGLDRIDFAAPQNEIPEVHITAETLPGAPPSGAFDYCRASYVSCSDYLLTGLRLMVGNSASPAQAFMNTASGPSLCQGSQDQYRFTDLSSPFYTTAPQSTPVVPTFNVGDVFTVFAATGQAISGLNNNVSIFMDWDGSGAYEELNDYGDDERIFQQASGSSVNYQVTIPTGVRNGVINGRIMVNDGTSIFDACEGEEQGETEDFQIQVNSPNTQPYPERAVACNVSGQSFTGFFVNCIDRRRLPVQGVYQFKVVN